MSSSVPRVLKRAGVTGLLLLAAMSSLGLATAALAADKTVSAGTAPSNNVFDPKSVTVNPGDTVTWTFSNANPHSVTADDGSFDSHPQCTGASGCSRINDTFTRRFDTPGTFAYHCRVHGANGGSGMSGTVVVQQVQQTTVPTTLPTTTTARPTTTTTVKPTTTTTAKPTTTTTTAAPTTTVTIGILETTTEPSTTTSTSTTLLAAGSTKKSGGGNLVLILVALMLVLGAGGYGLYRLWPRPDVIGGPPDAGEPPTRVI